MSSKPQVFPRHVQISYPPKWQIVFQAINFTKFWYRKTFLGNRAAQEPPHVCPRNVWETHGNPKKTCPGNAWKPQKVPRKLVEPPDFKPEIWLGSCKSVQKPILGVKVVSEMDMTETESWLCHLYTSKNFRNSGSHSQRRLFGKECKGNQHLIVLTLTCLTTVVSLWVLSEPAETLNSSVT